jgi:hypothetical protein
MLRAVALLYGEIAEARRLAMLFEITRAET